MRSVVLAFAVAAVLASGCAANVGQQRGSPPTVGTRPDRLCATPCPWRPVSLPHLGVTSQVTGMTATSATNVWVAAQAGRGWSHPQFGPDASWMEPPEHDVMLHWHAGQWTHVPVPATRDAITHMSSEGPSDIWAIADDSSLLHWNGHRWRLVPTPGERYGPLLGRVAALSPTDAWLVGVAPLHDGGSALIEHWNGHGWQRVHAPTIGHTTGLSAIAAASPTDVWAFGSYISDNPIGVHTTSGIVVEHWDGHRWQLVRQPVYHHTKHAFRIKDAVMVSPTDGWAVGSDRGIRAIALHWDGHRWAGVPTGGCCELLAVTASPTAQVWAAGYTTGRNTHAYQSRVEHRSGGQFRPVSAPNVGATTIDAVTALPDGTLYIAGTGANTNYTTYPILEQTRP